MEKENKMDARKIPQRKSKINIRAANSSSSRTITSMVNDTRGTNLSQDSDTGTDFFVHPFRAKGRGWRSGQDMIAGRMIRKDADGFEKLEDYLLCLSETDEESFQDLSSVEIETNKKKNVKNIPMNRRTRMSTRANNNSRLLASLSNDTKVTNQSQESDKTFVHPFRVTGKGWRSGRNFLANKVIRKVDGFEQIEDYFTESDADSSSVSRLSDGMVSDTSVRESIGNRISGRQSKSTPKAQRPISIQKTGEKEKSSLETSQYEVSKLDKTQKRESFTRKDENLPKHDSSSQESQNMDSVNDSQHEKGERVSCQSSQGISNHVQHSDSQSSDINRPSTRKPKHSNLLRKQSNEKDGCQRGTSVRLHTLDNDDTYTSSISNSDKTQQTDELQNNVTRSRRASKKQSLVNSCSGKTLNSHHVQKTTASEDLETSAETDEVTEDADSIDEQQESSTGSGDGVCSSDEDADNILTIAENVTNALDSTQGDSLSFRESFQPSQDVSGTVKKRPSSITKVSTRSSREVGELTLSKDEIDTQTDLDAKENSKIESYSEGRDFDTNLEGEKSPPAYEISRIISNNNTKLKKTEVSEGYIEDDMPIIAKRRPSVTFSDNIQEEVYITPTGVIEKSLLKTDRISMLRASQVSLDAGGTMTGSITKSQIAKISAAETPLTNLGTRKRLSYSVALDSSRGTTSKNRKATDSKLNCTDKSSEYVTPMKMNNDPVEEDQPGSENNNWLSSVLSAQQNNVEEVDEDVDFVVVDNTQTYTLNGMLSQRTGTQMKAKTKKSSDSESEGVNNPKRYSQKRNSETDSSFVQTPQSCIPDGKKNKKATQILAKKNGRKSGKTNIPSDDFEIQQKFVLSESDNASGKEKAKGRKRTSKKSKNTKYSGSASKKKTSRKTPKMAISKEILTNKCKNSSACSWNEISKDANSPDEQLQSISGDVEMASSMVSVDDGVFQSGVSIRSRKRIVTPGNVQPEEDIMKKNKKRGTKSLNLTSSTISNSPLAAVHQDTHSHITQMGLTPCLVKPGSRSRKKERRVTISEAEILPMHMHDNEGIETVLPTPSFSSSPKHFFEITKSQTPVPFKKPEKCKIIYPEPAPDGLRRSQRTRVTGLEWYKNERIVYERRKSGVHILGIKPSNEAKYNEMENEKRQRRKKLYKQRKKNINAETPRNMSVHMEMEDDLDITCSQEIALYNPERKEDVLVDCISTKDSQVFCGLSGEEPQAADPYIICKDLCHPCFRCGELVLHPMKEKPTEYVSDGVVIFSVVKGKVSVTIHKTTALLEPGDKFFVPSGNTYRIQNLRNENAKLSYTVLHLDENMCNQTLQEKDR